MARKTTKKTVKVEQDPQQVLHVLLTGAIEQPAKGIEKHNAFNRFCNMADLGANTVVEVDGIRYDRMDLEEGGYVVIAWAVEGGMIGPCYRPESDQESS
jgi:hypothetical protein